MAAYVDRREREHPLLVPVTVILSRRDGVVSWRSCLDHHSRLAEHVEVGSTHLGMVLDPDVWLTIARRLGVARAGPGRGGPVVRDSGRGAFGTVPRLVGKRLWSRRPTRRRSAGPQQQQHVAEVPRRRRK